MEFKEHFTTIQTCTMCSEIECRSTDATFWNDALQQDNFRKSSNYQELNFFAQETFDGRASKFNVNQWYWRFKHSTSALE